MPPVTVQKLEKRFHFKYLSSIAFENDQDRQEILRRGLECLKTGSIQQKALDFGQKYRTEIEACFFQKVQIKYVCR